MFMCMIPAQPGLPTDTPRVTLAPITPMAASCMEPAGIIRPIITGAATIPFITHGRTPMESEPGTTRIPALMVAAPTTTARMVAQDTEPPTIRALEHMREAVMLTAPTTLEDGRRLTTRAQTPTRELAREPTFTATGAPPTCDAAMIGRVQAMLQEM